MEPGNCFVGGLGKKQFGSVTGRAKPSRFMVLARDRQSGACSFLELGVRSGVSGYCLMECGQPPIVDAGQEPRINIKLPKGPDLGEMGVLITAKSIPCGREKDVRAHLSGDHRRDLGITVLGSYVDWIV